MIDRETKRRPDHALAVLIDNGPSEVSEVAEGLWPGGWTVGRETGVPVRKRNHLIDASRKLDVLASRGLVRHRTVEGKSLWDVDGGAARVWSVYVASRRVLAGVYDANLRVVGELSDRTLAVDSTDAPRLNHLLATSVAALMDSLLRLPPQDRGASAVCIGLPAAVEPQASALSRFNHQGWRAYAIADEFAVLWDAERQRRLASGAMLIPDLPTLPDSDRPALVIDTDVVLDTLAAMHSRRTGLQSHQLADHDLVLGVKYSGSLRSTLITRGAGFSAAGPARSVGVRSDSVFRGATGETMAIGHTVAPTRDVARRLRELVHDDQDVDAYAENLLARGLRCTCGQESVVHLDSLLTASRMAQRLKISDDRDLHRLWSTADSIASEDSERGDRARYVLSETGALVGHALDTAARLYDPSAIFVTGTLPFSEVLWESTRDVVRSLTPVVRSRERPRLLVRALDVEGPAAANDPIGPRGGAWLALDTFVHPVLMERARGTALRRRAKESDLGL